MRNERITSDSEVANEKHRDKTSKLEKLSYHVSVRIGKLFYKLGFNIAERPWQTIGICWLVVALCCLGFFKFENEQDPLKLWIPQNSEFLRNTKWIIDKFKEGTRVQSVLITADNDVLTPEILHKLAFISNEINNITTYDDEGVLIDLKRVCFKIPIISEITAPVEDNDEDENEDEFLDEEVNDVLVEEPPGEKPFNPIVDMDPKSFCAIMNKLSKGCLQENLVELWRFDEDKIAQLTKEKIIKAINKTVISPVSGHASEFYNLLGGVERNAIGEIISAKSVLSFWMLHVNFTDPSINIKKVGNAAGTEEPTTPEILAFELKFLETMERLKKELETDVGDGLKIYYSAGRSYADMMGLTMLRDLDKFFFGFVIMIFFMQIVLSKFSWTEIRLILTIFGLLCVGMAYVAGNGLASLIGFSYGPIHAMLPFLLMGLGVDDIFVIMACWRKVQTECQDGEKLSKKIGYMLQHAGVSISITSLTDIVAFLVGGSTIVPSLQSFCIFASLSIFMTYLFIITFFIAIFTLDEKRIEQNRNSFVPCIVHEQNDTKVWCQPNLMNRSINCIFSKVILTKCGKVFVILSVILFTGFNFDRVLKLQQKYDMARFLPGNTYFTDYIMKFRNYYPDRGTEASVFLGQLNYTQDMKRIMELSERIENQTQLLHYVQSWTKPLKDFVFTYYDKDITKEQLTDAEWHYYLSKFLYSAQGGKFQANFRFKDALKCGENTTAITMSTINFNFRKSEEREEYLPAMKAIENIVKNANLDSGDGISFLWGKIFGNWITDEVIADEIFRNIFYAIIGVFFCTALLIVNFQVCFYIFVSVLLTLINVGGTMQYFGMKIDFLTCMVLQLAVGLCVDYAAHIGHTFLMISDGDRNSRAQATVSQIGSAVMFGGCSTLFAVFPLGLSEVYAYKTFFSIFAIVVVWGLYFGIVLLPVVLSIVGPRPYQRNFSNKDMEQCRVVLGENKVLLNGQLHQKSPEAKNLILADTNLDINDKIDQL